MHISRTIIAILSGLGILSTLMPWKVKDQGAVYGFGGIEETLTIETGIGVGVGFVSIIIFLIAAITVIVGDRKKPLQPGFQKMGVIATAGILIIFHIVMISIYKIQKHVEPAYGLYISFSISFLILPIQFFFKKDGTYGMPTKDEIEDSLEESADIIEDTVEDIADKVEDRFDKDVNKEKFDNSESENPTNDVTNTEGESNKKPFE